MNKNIWIIIIFSIILIAIVALFFLFAQKKEPSPDHLSDTKPVVAATIFPLYDIVRDVAGEHATVELLLPPGASPHFFEFSPRQLDALQKTQKAFVIGHGIDDWANDAFDALNVQTITVDHNISLRDADAHHDHGEEDEYEEGEHEEDEHEHEEGEHEEHEEDEHEHGDVDPHYWLDPTNAIIITQTVANTLAELDPSHADDYKQNAATYISDLSQTDTVLQERLTTLPHKEIITIHAAWGYFADHFGLTIAGTFMPQAGEEPSPQYLEALEKAAKESSGGVIFSEPQLATDALKAFAESHDLKIAIIDPIGGVQGRDTYRDLMVYNIDTIINALMP